MTGDEHHGTMSSKSPKPSNPQIKDTQTKYPRGGGATPGIKYIHLFFKGKDTATKNSGRVRGMTPRHKMHLYIANKPKPTHMLDVQVSSQFFLPFFFSNRKLWFPSSSTDKEICPNRFLRDFFVPTLFVGICPGPHKTLYVTNIITGKYVFQTPGFFLKKNYL